MLYALLWGCKILSRYTVFPKNKPYTTARGPNLQLSRKFSEVRLVRYKTNDFLSVYAVITAHYGYMCRNGRYPEY